MLGVNIDVRFLHREKAQSLISVTESGMIVFGQPLMSLLVLVSIMALQLFLESYMGFSFATIIDVRF